MTLEQQSLFYSETKKPLAERLRPKNFSTFYGQEHLVAKNKILLEMISKDEIPSMIFWGPPGCGKTTLAKIISQQTQSRFIEFSAVNTGIKEVKDIIEKSSNDSLLGTKTIVFIDEIHRFNKLQQDVFLPYVENGTIILIGATTENPSFEINNALLSRMKVFILNKLTDNNILEILKNAIKNGFDKLQVDINEENLILIAKNANGDARYALSTLEMIILNSPKNDNIITIDDSILKQCLSKKTLMYDKNKELHYDLISALHKSMRNSDPDAAIYWLARMLEGGEDPLFIARRLIRFASEDVGLASKSALELAVNAYTACHYIGMPECNVVLAQVVVFLSLCPKSNALHTAYEFAKKDANNDPNNSVPLWLRNAATKLMKEAGYSKGYKYAHNYDEGITNMQCMPDNLKDKKYYNPTDRGEEKNLKEILNNIKYLKNK